MLALLRLSGVKTKSVLRQSIKDNERVRRVMYIQRKGAVGVVVHLKV